jgi:hypothetical protein
MLDRVQAAYMRTVFAGTLAASHAIAGRFHTARMALEDAGRTASILAEDERAHELLEAYDNFLALVPSAGGKPFQLEVGPAAGNESTTLRNQDDLRVARLILKTAASVPGDVLQDEPPETMIVGSLGGWFLAPDGRGTELSSRPTLARILARLVEARSHDPGRPVSAEQLIAVGWPGDVILPNAARNRLRVAISTLRKLGLGDAIVGGRGGYLLDRSIPLLIRPEG